MMLETLTIVSTALAITGLIFTAGYNWRRITVLEEAFTQHLESADKRVAAIEVTYARKDLIELEIKTIRSRLDDISKQLADLLARRDST